ncbi:Steroid 17-alpha-hydroxylase/17,20 lyase [Holothuria leucospilota]|uniref:Steroid 21-hydroxylase n=1 Tax=Holothuria leucospilota TaxID=206669 RepID=A0A9Q1CIY5_HOLLE|nr:Steroid 17-alpha-hydroxylase/17,20 lyase [Holothuria leucospilota]
MLGLAESSGVVANSTSLVLVSVATALVGLWVWSQQKPRKDFPPGPKGWPLIGNILEFMSDTPPQIIFMEHAKKYGDIFSIRIGQRWTVILNGAAVIKEALLKKGIEFANRPSSFSIDLFSEGGKDIVFGQFTPTWKLHRKLAYSAFRTLATGNNERFEKLVYSILPGLIKHLDSKGSEPFNPKTAMASSIYNILATMCFGKQFEFDGPEVKFWMRMSQQGIELVGNGLAADYIPIMKHIPTPAVQKLKNFTHEFYGAISKEMEEHKASEPKDLMEMLLQVRQEMEDDGSEDMTRITETHIRQTVANVFGAGTDTSIFTMHWSVGLLVQYPEVQAKVAAEVDKVVGRDRLPSLSDRDNLPYTTATLYEVMRYSTIVPLSVPHATSKEVEIGGYTIPEGTWVLVNLYSMHYDEKLWDEPHKFQPEHFLDETGEVRLHPEGFMPFSTGRRVCLGESVAKAELFLIFSWLFQHYKFSKAPGMEDEEYAESTTVAFGNMLKENDVVVEKRF